MNFKHYKRSNADRHYIWICSIDGTNSHITILQHHPNQSNSLIEEYASLDMPNVIITAIEVRLSYIIENNLFNMLLILAHIRTHFGQ